MEATRLSHSVWDDIFKAIRAQTPQREVYQGVVTDRDASNNVVWVRELSSEPIEVVGQGHDITYFTGGTRKMMRVPPAVPDIGDVVLLLRTSNDIFKCVGVLTSTSKWSAAPPLGLIPPDSITAREIAANAVGASELADNAVDTAALIDASITTAKFAAGAKAPDADLLDGVNSTGFMRGYIRIQGGLSGFTADTNFRVYNLSSPSVIMENDPENRMSISGGALAVTTGNYILGVYVIGRSALYEAAWTLTYNGSTIDSSCGNGVNYGGLGVVQPLSVSAMTITNFFASSGGTIQVSGFQNDATIAAAGLWAVALP
jgi:hypothetical protein